MKKLKKAICFNKQNFLKGICCKKSCRHWIDCKKYLNCTMVAAKEGPFTLQEIGDIHGLTRMRICQIEKNALMKIREKFSD